MDDEDRIARVAQPSAFPMGTIPRPRYSRDGGRPLCLDRLRWKHYILVVMRWER